MNRMIKDRNHRSSQVQKIILRIWIIPNNFQIVQTAVIHRSLFQTTNLKKNMRLPSI